ncbi:glucokinase [Alkalihalophilus pseudofirmus]|uniref:ROK family glucokinase n=1 Tax=Alkalihalobacterium alkalinitrilicum TaxID=427920 RepID=UPI00094D3008|nr:ROK family glucokinase [Alkalihalobacterium alkalinitrilicum]OLO26931.1 glucokinase [Alkalihalophilus pseudofirmus]
MVTKWFVGVDLGGTTIKLAFVDPYGDIIFKGEVPTNTTNGGTNITTDIAKWIDQALEHLGVSKDRLHSIGMGAPGFINMETGYIYQAVNIGWKDFHLKDRLEMDTSLPVTIDNDANIAALGEMWRGAGNGAKNLLCVTLGTGVGGGVIVNGSIVHGVNGMAGEIGHITAIPKGGFPCNCGKAGCLETISSATGISRIAKEFVSDFPNSLLANGNINAKMVFEAAEKNDECALKVIDHITYYLGFALANLANSLNPEKIVIGGGVSKAGETLLKPLENHFQLFVLPRVAQSVSIVPATLGNDAGVIGGAWLAKTKNR